MRPTTTARAPASWHVVGSSSRRMPPGVHESKPGSPKLIAPNERMVTPSTSLAGSIASNAARSSIWAGTGCCSRMPCTVGSADRRLQLGHEGFGGGVVGQFDRP